MYVTAWRPPAGENGAVLGGAVGQWRYFSILEGSSKRSANDPVKRLERQWRTRRRWLSETDAPRDVSPRRYDRLEISTCSSEPHRASQSSPKPSTRGEPAPSTRDRGSRRARVDLADWEDRKSRRSRPRGSGRVGLPVRLHDGFRRARRLSNRRADRCSRELGPGQRRGNGEQAKDGSARAP